MTRSEYSRRRFLKTAAAGAGVAAAGSVLISENIQALSSLVRDENALPGSSADEWESWRDETIQGFATDFSVLPGERVDFKIDTPATNYRVRIYRLGYYAGNGARHLADLTPTVGLPYVQPDPLMDPDSGLVDCGNWSVTASWQVPASAVSGVYYALFERLDQPNSSNHTFFVVRRPGPADILVQTSEMTMHAYNRYGGNSLYYGEPVGRAYKVSYNRPFGDGIGNENDFLNAEYALVRWLERNGYDVAYCAGIDVHRQPGLLNGHKVFVSSGHDEYVTGPQRANVSAARDAGVNLAFLTGNEYFWKVRLEPSIDGSGTPDRTIVCYKETLNNAKIDPSPEWTGTWRDGRFSPPSNGGLPENELTGQLFRAILPVNNSDLEIEVPAEYAPMRFWRDTPVASLQPGQRRVLSDNTLGYEFDCDVDNGFRPEGLIRLSSTTASAPMILQDEGGTYAPGTVVHHLTMYRAASGALVFGTGTNQWAYGLDEYHVDDKGSPVDPVIQQATVNVLADMGVQPSKLQSGLVAASASADALPPQTTITTPAPGTVLPVGSPATITGLTVDAGGGVVAAVEVSVDGGATWHPATGRASWSYVFVPTALGPIEVQARGVDDSCNIEVPTSTLVLEAGSRSLPCSIWPAGTTPTVAAANDTSPIEVGVKFIAEVDGFVNGLRFYKGPGNDGPHVGSLWSVNGAKLASASFDNETTTGWQTTAIPPVAVSAGTTYVASVFMPNGRYAADAGYFSQAYDLPPLRVPANGAQSGANGVFRYGAAGFPTSSWGAANYWVDIVYTDDNQIAPTVTDHVPSAGLASVSTTAAIVATFNEAMNPSSIVLEVRDPAGLAVTGTSAYDAGSRSASFTPASPLEPLTEYVATVTAAKDVAGNDIAAPFAWSFVTVGAVGTAPASIWDSSATPVMIVTNDTSPVELGTKFTSDVDGEIVALRYYKAPGSPGSHVGHLWAPNGDLLATTPFVTETASGWQQADLDVPVAIQKNQVYTVSYHSPGGVYPATPGGFGVGQFDRAPLHARAGGTFGGNGVYAYGPGTYPTSSWNNTNYWADVLLVIPPDTTGPTVTNVEPAPDLLAVSVEGPIRIRFNEPIDPGSVEVTVVGPTGSPVPLTISYDAATSTVTAIPDSALALDTRYTAKATATDVYGNPSSSPATWGFITDGGDGVSPATLWTHSSVPSLPDAGDASAIELGVRFRADRSGVITGIRYYKSAGNTGQHLGRLWSATGDLLASVTFLNETSSGWQQALFPTPVAITGGTMYVASYHAPNGHYAATPAAFYSQVQRGPLLAPGSSNGSPNGVFKYGSGGFPSDSYNAANYWVDVIYVDAQGPSLSALTPSNGVTSADPGTVVSATFDEPVQAGTIVMELRDSGGAVVSGTTSYDAATRVVSFAPGALLGAGATYTASISGAVDLGGNPMTSAVSWSFSVLGQTFTSIWGGGATPAVADSKDGGAVELGVKFRSSASGRVHGVRFYKGGTANGGVHRGSLWSGDGTLLATAVFSSETQSGWQTVLFDTPVSINPNATYVASYLAPQGRYSVTGGYFNGNAVTNGPLTALANGFDGGNGLYRYGATGGFPTGTYNGGNYWVDILFTQS